jgi:hypothetical protein
VDHIPVNPTADRRLKLPKRPKRHSAMMDEAALGAIFREDGGYGVYWLGPKSR